MSTEEAKGSMQERLKEQQRAIHADMDTYIAEAIRHMEDEEFNTVVNHLQRKMTPNVLLLEKGVVDPESAVDTLIYMYAMKGVLAEMAKRGMI